jgi:hypothetical protein
MLSIKLYNRDLVTPLMVQDLTMLLSGLKFSTRLHGGFNTCSFVIPANPATTWDWLNRKMCCRLVIDDNSRTIWEGRVEGVEPQPRQQTIDAYGYYAALTDQPYSTAYNDTTGNVIKAMLTAACPVISSDQSHIDVTGTTVDSAAGGKYLDRSVKDLVEMLAGFSDASGNAFYFAVWENRIPYFFKRILSSVDWKVSVQDTQNYNSMLGMTNLWTSCYAIYTSGGVLTRTATVTDAAAVTKWGIDRTYVIPNLGEVGATAADNAAASWVADNKNILPNVSNLTIGGPALDANGVEWPVYFIRAGDIIRLDDWLPVSTALSTVERDALSTFFITQTSYSADNNKLTITVEHADSALSAQLA